MAQQADQSERTPESAPVQRSEALRADLPGIRMVSAGFWVRLLALIIDLAVLVPVWWYATDFVSDSSFFYTNSLLWRIADWAGRMGPLSVDWLSTVIPLSYFVGMTAFKGQTVGKMVLRIRVVGPNEKVPGTWRALVRETVGKAISWVICGFGFISAGFSAHKRCWHDKIAGTTVIHVQTANRARFLKGESRWSRVNVAAERARAKVAFA